MNNDEDNESQADKGKKSVDKIPFWVVLASVLAIVLGEEYYICKCHSVVDTRGWFDCDGIVTASAVSLVLCFLVLLLFRAKVIRFGFCLVLIVSFMLIPGFTPMYHYQVPQSVVNSYAGPAFQYLCTQIGHYRDRYGCLPFGDSEVGSVTTWRTMSDGQYRMVLLNLKGDQWSTILPEDTALFRLGLSMDKLQGRFLRPDQVHYSCIAKDESGKENTKTYAYAIGVFGTEKKDVLRPGMGCAVLEAYFPEVSVSMDDGQTEDGYKLFAKWENYDRSTAVKGKPIRFGLEPEPGVCMLIPPEAFKPGAVTKLRGDGPDSVEYWVERLRAAPCGRWEIPELPEQ